jgi:hypothetical protein
MKGPLSKLDRARLVRVACIIGAIALRSPILASEDAMGCVKELAIPSSYSMFYTHLPATIEIHVRIGKAGRARSVTSDTQVQVMKLQMDRYFGEKTRYLDSCAGKTISFTVHYEVVEPALDSPSSKVRVDPPDQLFVICNRLRPALDPARPK